jgi:hypothetical protein
VRRSNDSRLLLRPRARPILVGKAGEVFIPYTAIGIGLALILGIWAFIEAESDRGRIFIAAVMIILFLLPVLRLTGISRLVQLIGAVVFGLGCYVFLRSRGAGIR